MNKNNQKLIDILGNQKYINKFPDNTGANSGTSTIRVVPLATAGSMTNT